MGISNQYTIVRLFWIDNFTKTADHDDTANNYMTLWLALKPDVLNFLLAALFPSTFRCRVFFCTAIAQALGSITARSLSATPLELAERKGTPSNS